MNNKVLKNVSLLTVAVLFFSFLCADLLKIKTTQAAMLGLPEPTQILPLSSKYTLPLLKGIRLNPENPLEFSFIVDTVDKEDINKKEAQKLLNYFLCGIVTDKKDIWVNLSPYESDRILSDGLKDTELGQDLLAQDYILKQISSSLISPNTEIGEEYWQEMNMLNQAASSHNKIWIVPNKAEIYESSLSAIVTSSSLKVLSEEDLNYSIDNSNQANSTNLDSYNKLLQTIETEVNTGKHFAQLRQLYSALILAEWFKLKFKESFFKNYINQNKTSGISITDEKIDGIYSLYCDSFKKGVFSLIKRDKSSQKKHKYFAGGYKNSIDLTKAHDLTGSSAIGNLVEISSTAITTEDTTKALKEEQYKQTIIETMNLDPKKEGIDYDITISYAKDGHPKVSLKMKNKKKDRKTIFKLDQGNPFDNKSLFKQQTKLQQFKLVVGGTTLLTSIFYPIFQLGGGDVDFAMPFLTHTTVILSLLIAGIWSRKELWAAITSKKKLQGGIFAKAKFIRRHFRRNPLSIFSTFWSAWNPFTSTISTKPFYALVGGNKRPALSTFLTFMYTGIIIHPGFAGLIDSIYETIFLGTPFGETQSLAHFFKVWGFFQGVGVLVMLSKFITFPTKKLKSPVKESAAETSSAIKLETKPSIVSSAISNNSDSTQVQNGGFSLETLDLKVDKTNSPELEFKDISFSDWLSFDIKAINPIPSYNDFIAPIMP